MFHNYIRPHEALDGKTPSEACGITIEGKNKWITLIQNIAEITQKFNYDSCVCSLDFLTSRLHNN